MADGARADVFEELLGRGDLPNISRYIVDRGSFFKAVSVFPSTTGPAYAPFIVGRFPGRCNLPGIRWFDREQYSKRLFSYRRFRSYVGIETFLMNSDISTDSKTLFEVFPKSISILNELNRGVSFTGDKTRFMRIYYKIKSHFTNRSDEVDLAARRMLLKSLGDFPQFSYAVFLGIDTYSHSNHPFHRRVLDSYLQLDETVGHLGDALAREGRLDETLLIIASDHGLTPTHSHLDTVEFMSQLGFKTFHYPKVYQHFRDADAATMISGNAMAHIYVKSPNGWGRRSTFEELNKIIERLIERQEIDIVAGIDEEGRVRITGKRGGEATAWIDKEGYLNYRTFNGDPFDYRYLPEKMNIDEALELTYNTNYPDGILQIIQLLESPRSGDLVVSANPGFDLRARHEKPEHCSSHGGLFKEHMLVPVTISAKVNKAYARTVDLYPTILSLMGYPLPAGIDGVTLVR
ncbi:MAG: alkaline phosphatase family protein [Thermodesulfobacteriota bacterium]